MKFSTFQTPISAGAEHDGRIIQEVIRAAKRLDEGGFGCFYLAEHHFTGYSAYSNNFMLASYLAAATQQIHLGFLVAVVPLHHPFRLAEQANLLDQLSQGRFVFGVGSGGIPFESLGLGQPIDEQQNARMEELLPIVFEAWAHTPDDEPLAFKTDHYEGTLYERIMPAAFTPGGPVVKRACESERGIRYAAKMGFAAHIFPRQPGIEPFQALSEWWDLYRRELEAAGHDDAVVERCLAWTSGQTNVAIGESREEAMGRMMGGAGNHMMDWVQRQLALEMKYIGRNPVNERLGIPQGGGSDAVRAAPPSFDGPVPKGMTIGTPEDVAKGLKDYEALGLQELLIGMDVGIGYDAPRTEERFTMDQFIDEVMPLL